MPPTQMDCVSHNYYCVQGQSKVKQEIGGKSTGQISLQELIMEEAWSKI